MAVGVTVVVAVIAVLALALGLWLFGERGHLLLPSTKRSLRLGLPLSAKQASRRKRPSSWKTALASLEGYVYGRWTNQYISVLLHRIMPRLDAGGKQRLADRYHGKVLTHEQARAIVVLDKPIRRDLEQIIPYPMARDFILKAPPEIAAYECGCRHARSSPCQPTQVCMVVGSAVEFILEHNPHSSRRLTQPEALELLRAEHERGHLHSAWFKDVLGDRFYAICNCCKCCCGGIEAMRDRGIPMVASSGFVISIDAEQCTACGACVPACPFDALTLNGDLRSDWQKCMGCGVCVDQCPVEALTLVRDERKGMPLDVRQLVA